MIVSTMYLPLSFTKSSVKRRTTRSGMTSFIFCKPVAGSTTGMPELLQTGMVA